MGRRIKGEVRVWDLRFAIYAMSTRRVLSNSPRASIDSSGDYMLMPRPKASKLPSESAFPISAANILLVIEGATDVVSGPDRIRHTRNKSAPSIKIPDPAQVPSVVVKRSSRCAADCATVSKCQAFQTKIRPRKDITSACSPMIQRMKNRGLLDLWRTRKIAAEANRTVTAIGPPTQYKKATTSFTGAKLDYCNSWKSANLAS